MKAHGSWLDGFVRWFVNASPADIDERELAPLEQGVARDRRLHADRRLGDRRSPMQADERHGNHP